MDTSKTAKPSRTSLPPRALPALRLGLLAIALSACSSPPPPTIVEVRGLRPTQTAYTTVTALDSNALQAAVDTACAFLIDSSAVLPDTAPNAWSEAKRVSDHDEEARCSGGTDGIEGEIVCRAVHTVIFDMARGTIPDDAPYTYQRAALRIRTAVAERQSVLQREFADEHALALRRLADSASAHVEATLRSGHTIGKLTADGRFVLPQAPSGQQFVVALSETSPPELVILPRVTQGDTLILAYDVPTFSIANRCSTPHPRG